MILPNVNAGAYYITVHTFTASHVHKYLHILRYLSIVDATVKPNNPGMIGIRLGCPVLLSWAAASDWLNCAILTTLLTVLSFMALLSTYLLLNLPFLFLTVKESIFFKPVKAMNSISKVIICILDTTALISGLIPVFPYRSFIDIPTPKKNILN